MRLSRLVLVMMFASGSAAFAQDKPSQAAPASSTGPGPKAQMPRHQHMIEMHKQMDAMKADIEKMKSSLAQMKANLLTIKDTNELARWRNNADMWDTLIGHMERMQKNMESMGPDMMHGQGMGGLPPTPKRPQ